MSVAKENLHFMMEFGAQHIISDFVSQYDHNSLDFPVSSKDTEMLELWLI